MDRNNKDSNKVLNTLLEDEMGVLKIQLANSVSQVHEMQILLDMEKDILDQEYKKKIDDILAKETYINMQLNEIKTKEESNFWILIEINCK